MRTIVKYEKQRRGNLGFMLFWQSLDGRPQYEYHGMYRAAVARYKSLVFLGRKPQIYRQVIV